ncbi:anti-sigma factor [Actinoplanes sp. Pm04-4]|uniref:Regulator of SigK n=1 Tax=Paractinoplanes pyxinae TaxID=2997416 RepID=A0ABT4BB81_9ACTN|nr:anti-sigma factor [Actinoplanes pyxinae]MCY1143731.1 anti-sigma factor [Actinoplanes pyxinae]
MTTDVHSLVGPYALDALDDLERAAFERHLRECQSCRSDADELREAATHLADGAWAVPPPRLRDNVLAEIRNTPQGAPSSPPPPPARTGRRSHRFSARLAAAAAVTVTAALTGTVVYAVQDRRVRHEQAVADAAQANDARIRSILAAPDLAVREERLTSGGKVTVMTSQLRDAGVILLAADAAPDPGRIYQLWSIRSGTPASVKALGEGEATTVQIVQGLPGASEVGVTVEPAPGSTTPTTPLDALVSLT